MNNRLKILALDQASQCGWCLSKDINGVWDIRRKKDESEGMKMLRFRSKLKEVHSKDPIDVIVYERVAGMHKSSIIHSAKMVTIIETFCEENNIQYRAYSAGEIKSFASGKGNCNKDVMIKTCKTKYGINPIDDNHADAIHLWHLADSDLN